MSFDVTGNEVRATLKWWNDSPPEGSRRLRCSLCGEVIRPQDGPPLRVWNQLHQEARLHRACLALISCPPMKCAKPFLEALKDAPPKPHVKGMR